MEAVITDKAAGVVLTFGTRLFYNQALRIETPLNGCVRVSDSTGCGDFVDKSGFDERKHGVHHATALGVPLPVPHTGSSCLWTSLVHSLPTPPPQHRAGLMNTSEPGLGR